MVFDEAKAEGKVRGGGQGNARLARDAVEEAVNIMSVEIEGCSVHCRRVHLNNRANMAEGLGGVWGLLAVCGWSLAILKWGLGGVRALSLACSWLHATLEGGAGDVWALDGVWARPLACSWLFASLAGGAGGVWALGGVRALL